ncbi:MAG: hypothetical protein Q8R12_05055 [bacterium]|nr:hypothetical protein [bacterium]
MAYFLLVDVVALDLKSECDLSQKVKLGYIEAESLDIAAELLSLGEPNGKGYYHPNSDSVYALKILKSTEGLEPVRDFTPYVLF